MRYNIIFHPLFPEVHIIRAKYMSCIFTAGNGHMLLLGPKPGCEWPRCPWALWRPLNKINLKRATVPSRPYVVGFLFSTVNHCPITNHLPCIFYVRLGKFTSTSVQSKEFPGISRPSCHLAIPLLLPVPLEVALRLTLVMPVETLDFPNLEPLGVRWVLLAWVVLSKKSLEWIIKWFK